MNYRIRQFDKSLVEADVVSFSLRAQQAFFAAVSYSPNTAVALQDILRLISLWSECRPLRENPDTVQQIIDGIRRVPLSCWASVVPQLVGHLYTGERPFRELIEHALSRLCLEMPQATVFALLRMVLRDFLEECAHGSVAPRVDDAVSSATHLLHLCDPILVRDAQAVSRVLASAAVTPLECVHDLVAKIVQLGTGRQRSATTIASACEWARIALRMTEQYNVFIFDQVNTPLKGRLQRLLSHLEGSDLLNGVPLAGRIQQDLVRDMNRSPLMSVRQAAVNGRLSAEAAFAVHPTTHGVPLSVVVPGEFRASSELHAGGPRAAAAPNGSASPISAAYGVCTVLGIEDAAHVMATQHRPRKVGILGSDGHRYVFVLKGREDLRQDERVMQLFGFVNTQLASLGATAAAGVNGRGDGEAPARDTATFSSSLASVESLMLLPMLGASACIQTYGAIPLTKHVGLLGWVGDTNTFSECIVQHRNHHNIYYLGEKQALVEHAGGPVTGARSSTDSIEVFDKLARIQRAEALAAVRLSHNADDIARTLWLDCPSSEEWLQRRRDFTASTAVSSIVGYVIGLGDRHLGNLMLSPDGRVVHVDFGDCFDVARIRMRHPETVPFRLTPMLVNAMDVSGVQGPFRSIAVTTMCMLRDNRDSITALLNAFVHDPTVTFRIDSRAFESNELRAIVETLRGKLWGSDRPGSATPFSMRQQKNLQPAHGPARNLDPVAQVELLIREATDLDNLGSMFRGWCAWL